MIYLTYGEYTDIGGTLDLTAFDRNIARACGIIDNATFCRIENMAEVPQNAKHLCRDLIEYVVSNHFIEATVSSRSQSAGGVSESESYNVKSLAEMQEEITKLIFDYLYSVKDDNGAPVLYRGCLK